MSGLWLVLFSLQWALLIALSLIMVGVLRYLGRIQDRIDLAAPQISRFETGEVVSDFRLPTWDGAEKSFADIRTRNERSILLFVTSSCGSCKALVTQLMELAGREPSVAGVKTKIVVVSGGGPLDAGVSEPLTEAGISVLVDKDGTAFSQFGIRSIPTGLLIDPKGAVKDQSMNPHAANWLYRTLEVAAPAQPLQTGWTSLMTPTADFVSPRL